MSNESSFITRILNNASRQHESSLERLASGSRINRAKDDAAGLAIAASLDASVKSLQQGSRNAADGQSALQMADSALGQMGDIAARLKELSMGAANGTLSSEQRSSLSAEYTQLTQEMNRIAQTTEFNGQKLLAQSGFALQVGNDASADSQVQVQGVNADSFINTAASQDISTQAGAENALAAIDSVIQNVASARGQLGALTARLDAAVSNNGARVEAETAASARIRDLDFAQEIANKTSNEIRLNTSAALLGQANNIQVAIVQKLLG